MQDKEVENLSNSEMREVVKDAHVVKNDIRRRNGVSQGRLMGEDGSKNKLPLSANSRVHTGTIHKPSSSTVSKVSLGDDAMLSKSVLDRKQLLEKMAARGKSILEERGKNSVAVDSKRGELTGRIVLQDIQNTLHRRNSMEVDIY